MKLDIHTHILPNKLPDLQQRYGCPGWINIRPDASDPNVANMYKDDVFFRRIERNCMCVAERCEDMRKTGVTSQVLSTVPVMFNYQAKAEHCLDLSRLLNDDIAAQTRFRSESSSTMSSSSLKQFYAFGTIPMQDATLAVEEMTRCMRDLGLSGIQIGTNVNGVNLDDKSLYPIWRRAEELQCPIFVHPWDMEHVSRTTKYWLPWLVGMPAETTTAICSLIMGNVLALFPRLKFCFAHGGGAFPFTVGRIQHGYDCRPDLCATDCAIPPKEFLGKIYTDSLVHSKPSLDLLIQVIGKERIILGSDYPFPLGELDTGALIESTNYDDDLKARLLYKNGMEFLGLSTTD